MAQLHDRYDDNDDDDGNDDEIPNEELFKFPLLFNVVSLVESKK